MRLGLLSTLPKWCLSLLVLGTVFVTLIYSAGSALIDKSYTLPPVPPSVETIQINKMKELAKAPLPGPFVGDCPGGFGAKPPPPLPLSRPELMRVGSGYMQSKIVRKIEPLLPEVTTLKRLDADLHLEVIVDEQGIVQSARVLYGGGHPSINEAATEAVKKWKYTPTYLNGIPIKVVFELVLPFRYPRSSRP